MRRGVWARRSTSMRMPSPTGCGYRGSLSCCCRCSGRRGRTPSPYSCAWRATTLRCGAVRCIAVRRRAVRCREMQCGARQCSAVQCSAVRRHYLENCNGYMMRFSAVQCSAVKCSAVQCSAVQCSAVQCSKTKKGQYMCMSSQHVHGDSTIHALLDVSTRCINSARDLHHMVAP